MYLALCTRPDLSMAVSVLSRYYQNSKMEHWDAAKRVLRFLKGTVGEGLACSPGERTLLCGGIAMQVTEATMRQRKVDRFCLHE